MAAVTTSSCVPSEVEIPEDKGAKKEKDLGLALEWDNIASVRAKMRAGWNLVTHFDCKLKLQSNARVEKSLHNVKNNADVLKPVCAKIRQQGLLPVDKLDKEVKAVFAIHNVTISMHEVSKQGWAIRHLIRVLKAQVRNEKVNGVKRARWPKDKGE